MDISGKERVGVAVIVVLAVAAAVTGICVRSCRKAPEPAPSDLVFSADSVAVEEVDDDLGKGAGESVGAESGKATNRESRKGLKSSDRQGKDSVSHEFRKHGEAGKTKDKKAGKAKKIKGESGSRQTSQRNYLDETL